MKTEQRKLGSAHHRGHLDSEGVNEQLDRGLMTHIRHTH